MNLGGRLKKAREYRDLTQGQLAALVPGLAPESGQQLISALENRDSETTTLLFEFADALKINPRWLQTGRGDSWLEKPPSPPAIAAEKLITVYGQISEKKQDELVNFANYLASDGNHGVTN